MDRGPGAAVPRFLLDPRKDRAGEAAARAPVSRRRRAAAARCWGWRSSRRWSSSTKCSRPARPTGGCRSGSPPCCSPTRWRRGRCSTCSSTRPKPRLNLGTLFLALDIPAFVWVIYQTGADNSWLFFLLYIRVADQTNTTFKRALGFSHVAVASYALLILYLALRRAPRDLVAGRSVQAADPLRRQPLRRADRAHRRTAAGADGGGDPLRARHGDQAAGAVARARARARAGRGIEPHQERVPRQHEPRDPHADERHHGHDRRCCSTPT